MSGKSNYIFCLMGKSATGKDTIYRKLRERLTLPGAPDLMEVVPYTTRPIRVGEENGREYYYESEEQFAAAKEAGRIIEDRAYNTVRGIWRYYTKDDGQIDLNAHHYLIIATLESYTSYRKYFGEKSLVPFYLEVEERERLRRAIHREDKEASPHYSEICRRFLADEEDFSEEKLAAAGITRRYVNSDSEACTEMIYKEICRNIVSTTS